MAKDKDIKSLDVQGLEKVVELLNRSPSVFHVVSNIKQIFLETGFEEINEDMDYVLEKGHNYFLTRNMSSIIAFKIPENGDNSFKIAATHNDSPTFKVKPDPIVKFKNLSLLNVEPYGGAIFSTWFDRPLSLAGRVMVKKGDTIEPILFNVDEDLLVIPNLAIHMNRGVNDGVEINPSSDTLPILGEGAIDFVSFLEEEMGLKEGEEVISHDLYLYNRTPATLVGHKQEFLTSPRLDDLSSTYSSLLAFASSEASRNIDVFASFDNEEVGSLTRQGAQSDFLLNTLKRIGDALGFDSMVATAKSYLLSVDNAHANHPAKPSISDQTTDVVLNGGVVLKYNANQSYTSDGLSSSVVKAIAQRIDESLQEFTNRSDLKGGSTLGNLSNSQVSVLSCDIGIPQLAMHSSYETLGAKDVVSMIKLLRQYFATTLKIDEKKIEII